MSDENTVGHYKSHPLGEVIESLRTKTETLQQVVFEKDKTILEWRCELIGISARLRAANLDLFAQEIEALIGTTELKDAQDDCGWISVKDRLPEDGKEVICYEFDYAIYTLGDYRRGKWDISSERPRVTHWRELPTPPKEKG